MINIAVAAIGLLSGLVGGLFGVGGGVVIVPLLILALGISTKTAIGTSLAVIIPTSIMAALRHYQLGNVDLRLAALMAAGALIGALAGASLTAYVSGEWLRRGFAVFLILTAIRMLMK